jgi:hypothetical protein
MAIKPYMTSNDLIAAIKRKISFPTSQVTFNEDDILAFANEEMFIAQVPSVLQFHEEFFVSSLDVQLLANKTRYAIPNRAIGMKIRDLFFKDTNGNLYNMARINPEEKAYFQRDFNKGGQSHPYYLEGNEVVLTSTNLPNPNGSLTFSFFLRPNQLVVDENAATIESFGTLFSVVNASVSAGDQLVVTNEQGVELAVYTATIGIPAANEFLIGGTGTITATNIVNLFNLSNFATASNSAVNITLTYSDPGLTLSAANTAGFVINPAAVVNFDAIPTNIVNGELIDFLQTNPGHRILSYDVAVPSSGISGTSILFTSGTVPLNTIVGDYICLANTAIIPYIPPDLHNVLAERASARILSSIGDLENLGAVQAKIKEMEMNQGMLLDNRIEGRPQKVSSKNSLIRYSKKNRF